MSKCIRHLNSLLLNFFSRNWNFSSKLSYLPKGLETPHFWNEWKLAWKRVVQMYIPQGWLLQRQLWAKFTVQILLTSQIARVRKFCTQIPFEHKNTPLCTSLYKEHPRQRFLQSFFGRNLTFTIVHNFLFYSKQTWILNLLS